jgi:hypothetical protein
LAGQLRPYQVRGYSWLAFLRKWGLGACLADDMGLGKTIQAIALLLHERQGERTGPALVICPTSVVGNWKREVQRFAPKLRVMVHHGGDRASGEELRRHRGRARRGHQHLRPGASRRGRPGPGALERRHPRRGAEHQEPPGQTGPGGAQRCRPPTASP